MTIDDHRRRQRAPIRADDAVPASIAATLAYQVRRDHPPHRLPARRDAHPKHHGTVQAELIVDPDVPEALRHGVFATPGRRYDAWIRFSNAFRVRHDVVRDARGMAVKLLGVDGPRLPASVSSVDAAGVARTDLEAREPAGQPAALVDAEPVADTQDFLMVTHAAFFAATATDFLDFPAAVSGFAPGTGSALASTLRFLGFFFRLRPFRCRWRAFLALQRSSVQTLSPLTLRYFSQTPYRLGPHVVKFGVRPHRRPSIGDRLCLFARGLAYRFKRLPFVNVARWEHALRDELFRATAEGDITFDFLIQRRPSTDTDTDTHADSQAGDDTRASRGRRDRLPIDDATVVWGEGRAPFVKVGTIRIPRQALDAAGVAERLALGEHLSFSPWHTLAAHEPIGSINRARRVVYERIAALRHQLNGVRRVEPRPGESAAEYLRRAGTGAGAGAGGPDRGSR